MRLSVLLLVLLVTSVAQADPPTMRVLRIEGDRGRVQERALARALRDAGVEVGPNGDVVIRGALDDDTLSLRVRLRRGSQNVEARGDTPRERAERAASAVLELVGEPRSEPQREPDPEPEPEALERAEPEEREEEAPARPSRAERARERARSSADADAYLVERSELSAFTFELTGGVLRRRLAFRDDLFGTVSNYTLGGAPTIGLAASWFPGAHGSVSHPLAGIGVLGDFRAVLGLTSESPTGEVFDTRSMSASVDVAYRIPAAAHAVMGRVGYGSETFYVEPAEAASPDGRNAPRVPRTFYRFVRIAADADLHVAGPFRFVSHAGLRVLLHTGELDDWFPRNRGMGFELGLGFVLAFDVLTLRLSADYVRYAFAFHPRPGEPDAVGGASDDWLVFGFALGVRVRGVP